MHRNTIGRLAILLAASILASVASAAAQRSFVSATGIDNPSCSIAAPCRGFAAAVAATLSGGEVIALDSAGYGAVTITKPISIIAPTGIYAGISVFSGNGITISAGPSDEVTLRGLTINGLGGLDGISFASGRSLTVEDCEISGMSFYGINAFAANSTVSVKHTVLRRNLSSGFRASGSVLATLSSINASRNDTGVLAQSGARVTVSDSVFSDNSAGAWSLSEPGTTTQLLVTRCTISGNDIGLYVFSQAAGNASLVSDANAITFDSQTAFKLGSSGGAATIFTRGNNTGGYFANAVTGGSLTPLGPL